jgi:TfoX/Sxy family transcriptional regulator of competence genes
MGMMKWQKSPPELERTFADAFPDDPRAERKKMFGYPAGFVNGNMFGGLCQADIVLRLGDADREQLAREHGAEPFEPMGRPMKGYVIVPKRIAGDAGQLRSWVERAFTYAALLPPKEKKAVRSASGKARGKPGKGRSASV